MRSKFCLFKGKKRFTNPMPLAFIYKKRGVNTNSGARKRGRTLSYVPATAMSRRRSKYSRARIGLARMAYNRRKPAATRRLSNLLNKIGETKLLPIGHANELAAVPIQVGAKAYMCCFCMGTKPTAWTSTWNNLLGMTIPIGDTANSRDGNYVYLQHTRLAINIDTQNNNNYRPPMQYRMIVGKSRRGTNPAGITQDPAVDLFIDVAGNSFGHATSGVNGSDLMMQPINKRDWYVKMDRKFTLSTPLEDQGGGYSGKYPTTKDVVVRLPYYKKTKYANDGPLKDLPLDIDYSYFVIIYARSQQKDTDADDWEVNLRGTTCFKDV